MSNEYKDFKLENGDLKKLDEVCLDFDTAAAIAKKFKIPNNTKLKDPDVKKAVDTFNCLLENTTKTEINEKQKKYIFTILLTTISLWMYYQASSSMTC